MPDRFKHREYFNLKIIFQLIAGILFFAVGIYIMLSGFENNYILVGSTKYMFGGILCLYGIVRIGRVYQNWKSKLKQHYENDED